MRIGDNAYTVFGHQGMGGDISVAAVVSRDDSIRPRNVPAVDWPALLNLLCVLSSNQNSK